MSPHGRLYLVAVPENDPKGIIAEMIGKGFDGEVRESHCVLRELSRPDNCFFADLLLFFWTHSISRLFSQHPRLRRWVPALRHLSLWPCDASRRNRCCVRTCSTLLSTSRLPLLTSAFDRLNLDDPCRSSSSVVQAGRHYTSFDLSSGHECLSTKLAFNEPGFDNLPIGRTFIRFQRLCLRARYLIHARPRWTLLEVFSGIKNSVRWTGRLMQRRRKWHLPASRTIDQRQDVARTTLKAIDQLRHPIRNQLLYFQVEETSESIRSGFKHQTTSENLAVMVRGQGSRGQSQQ